MAGAKVEKWPCYERQGREVVLWQGPRQRSGLVAGTKAEKWPCGGRQGREEALWRTPRQRSGIVADAKVEMWPSGGCQGRELLWKLHDCRGCVRSCTSAGAVEEAARLQKLW